MERGAVDGKLAGSAIVEFACERLGLDTEK